jgi:tetratricopeptide (TPR) repeat protein
MSLQVKPQTADAEAAVRKSVLAQLGKSDPKKFKRTVERSMRSTLAVNVSFGHGYPQQPPNAKSTGGEDLVTIEFPDGPVTRDRNKFTPMQEAQYQANEYMEQEDWPNAVEAYRKLIDLNPEPIMLQGVLIMMGVAYHYMGDLNHAQHAFEEAISIDERTDVAHLFLGTTRMLAGDFENAIGPLKKSLELDPHNSNANFFLGHAYSELGQWEEAIAAYNAEIAEHREFTPSYEQLGRLYFKLSEENPTERWQYFLRIIETYKKWLKVDPDNSSVRNLVGYLYTQLGDIPEAMKAFAEAVKVKPDNVVALSNWGVACLNAERTSEAREIFKRLASFGEDVVREQLSYTSPENLDEEVRLAMAETFQLLGAANLKLHQSQAEVGGVEAADRSLLLEAEAAYQTALSYNPVDVHSLYNLGLVYYILRRRAAATRLLSKVLELNPEFPDAADVLHKIEGELEQWRRWIGNAVGTYASTGSDKNPVSVEDLIEKLAECRAKLYEGVDPAHEDDAFSPEDLLNAMLPVAKWLSKNGGDDLRFRFAAMIFERGWLSSGKAARLADLDRVTFLTNLYRVGIAVLDLDEEELENQARYVNAQ